MLATDISALMPEIMLAVYAMAALMWGVYFGKDDLAKTILWTTIAVFVVLAFYLGYSHNGAATAFDGTFINDRFHHC